LWEAKLLRLNQINQTSKAWLAHIQVKVFLQRRLRKGKLGQVNKSDLISGNHRLPVQAEAMSVVLVLFWRWAALRVTNFRTLLVVFPQRAIQKDGADAQWESRKTGVRDQRKAQGLKSPKSGSSVGLGKGIPCWVHRCGKEGGSRTSRILRIG